MFNYLTGRFRKRNDKTFVPVKGRDKAFAQSLATLKAGCDDVAILATCTCPEGTATEDWLAAGTADQFRSAALVFGLISESCTEAGCPSMTAGVRAALSPTTAPLCILLTLPLTISPVHTTPSP